MSSQAQVAERRRFEWTVHSEAQAAILKSQARFPIAAMGRRFGKSECAFVWLCLEADRLVKQGHAPASLVLWWVLPDYPTAALVHRKLVSATTPQGKPNPFAPFIVDQACSPGSMWLKTTWGWSVHFKTAEKERALVATAVHAAVVDEAAAIRERSWDNELRPALADTQARALLISSPKGKNWFYRCWLRGKAREAGFEAFTAPTHANPYIHRAELDELRAGMTNRAYRQEVLAEFLEDSGAFFRSVRARVRGELEPPGDRVQYVAGWDPAKHEDYSVLTVLRLPARHVVSWERMPHGLAYPMQRQRVAAACRRYNYAALLMDSTGVGDPLYDDMLREANGDFDVQGFKFTHTSKQDLLNALALALSDDALSYPDIPELVNELEVYEAKDSAGTKTGAPEGFHDDCVMSLALANWVAARGSEPIGAW